MKRILLTTALALVSLGAFAQGTIGFINTSATLVTTNGATSGSTGTGAQGFFYTLFTTPYNPANPLPAAPLLTDLGGSTWVWTGSYGTNIAAAGRLSGGNNVPTAQNWAPGETRAYVILGYSSNLGHDWTAIQSQIASGSYANGAGFIGVSSMGFGIAGGGPLSLPFFPLFGSGATASGTPITSGFPLNAVPEPATFALAGLGSAVMLTLRRRR